MSKIVISKPVSLFRYDKRKKGWKLVKNVKFGNGDIPLRFDRLLRGSEFCVNHRTMMNRAKGMGNLAGQLHAEYLFAHQENISKKLKKFNLVFAGTVWRDSDGDLRMPCLYWENPDLDHDGGWSLCFEWFGDHFFSNVRLARLSK